jgi:hypothetical protein
VSRQAAKTALFAAENEADVPEKAPLATFSQSTNGDMR